MLMKANATARFGGRDQKERDIDATVVGADEFMRHADERKLRLTDSFHAEFHTSFD
jgi:hypothetical protein